MSRIEDCLHIFPLFIRYCQESTLTLLFNSPLKKVKVKKAKEKAKINGDFN